jgi:integrase family protein with SAM-like domain
MSVVVGVSTSSLAETERGHLRVQQVLPPGGGPDSWTVLDEQFAVVQPVDAFLAHLTAIERSPGTVRAYAFDLRDYFEFLTAHEIDWRAVRLEHPTHFAIPTPQVCFGAVSQPRWCRNCWASPQGKRPDQRR